MEIFGLDMGTFAFCAFSFIAGAYVLVLGLRSKSETKLFKGACVVLGGVYMAITVSTFAQLKGVQKYFGVVAVEEKADAGGYGDY